MKEKTIIKLFIDKSIYSAKALKTGSPLLIERSRSPWFNRYAGYMSDKAFTGYDESQREAEELIKKLCEQYSLEYIVYDISHKKNRLIAGSLGIKSTPTVIIKDKIITGSISKINLLRALGIETEFDRINFLCPQCKSSNIEICSDRSGACKDCNNVFMNAEEK